MSSEQPQCPKCAFKLKDDYGMVTCPSCGSIVFVDMDGHAHIGSEDPATGTATEPAAEELDTDTLELSDPGIDPHATDPAIEVSEPTMPVSLPPFDQSLVDLQSDESAEDRQVHILAPPEMPIDFQVPPVSDEFAASSDAAMENLATEPEPAAMGGELDMDALLGYQEPEADALGGAPGAAQVEFGAPGDPLALNEYANSELSQAKDGLLTFKILISGIDSKEMRESLRSALDDRRFGWNPADLMSRITKGTLQIDNVAPVKAVILVNRIKRLAVKIRWEQYAITQMDGN